MTTTISRISFFVCCSAALAVCLTLAPSAQGSGTAPQSLDAYRNKNRVLLVFAPSAGETRYKKQSELLRGKGDGHKERDLVIFSVFEKPNAPLRKQYGVKSGEFRVILVGKDGHTAYRTERPVVISDLFRRIDRMPMRRDEMRQRGR